MTNPIDGLKVDLGLGSYPLTPLASVSWTDVTSDVLLREGVSFNRGRGSQDDAASPGRLSFTLNNAAATGKLEGRWTRGGSNATGGWDLRAPVRVRHAAHGTLWVGYVDAIEHGWENGVRPLVRVQASDRLAQFQRIKLPGLVRGEQEYDEPALAWPLDNAAGTTTVPDRHGTLGGALTLRRTSEVGAVEFAGATFGVDDAPAPDFTSDTYLGYYLDGTPTSAITASTEVTIEAWVKFAALPYNGILSIGDPSGAPLSVYTSGGGNLIAALDDTSGSHSVDAGVVEVDRWYHIAVTYYETLGAYTNATLWLDGTSIGTATRVMSWEVPTEIRVARDRYINTTLNGSIANVAIYPEVLAYGRIAAHATAGLPSGETAAARWERVCRLAGLDAADYDTTGSSLAPTPTIGTQAVKDRPYIDAAQECAAVEDGVSFLDRTGAMRLHLRDVRMGATAGLTLGPADVDSDTIVLADTDRVLNDVTVTRTGGGSQRVVNAYSVAYYGTQNDTIDLPCETDEQALNAAEWIRYERGYPDARVDAVTVDLVAKAATVDSADALTADLSTLIELDGLPTPASHAATFSLFVEGIADSITESTWRRTFTTSAAERRLNVFTLDDADLGDLDTGGVLA